MSVNNKQNSIPEEIDLGIFFLKINKFFSNFPFAVFKGIVFIKNNFIIILILFVLGSGLGSFIDKYVSTYDNQIIVTPNLSSVYYLYNKIYLLSSKLKENDKVFFKSIGVNSEIISSIEIEPIIDVYSFINDSKPVVNVQNTQNFELVKLLSESGDINKVIKDKTTSKNYPNHLIHILTTDQIKNEEIVKPILNFLNTDEYLNQLLKISRENINIKIKKNEQIIAQTDSLLHAITKNLSNNQKSFNLVYSNEDNHFNLLFETKNNLEYEIAEKRIEAINYKKVINDISTVTNIKSTKGVNGKMKLILPILPILIFISIRLFLSFYKIQSAKLIK
jgi:hypothetical protein